MATMDNQGNQSTQKSDWKRWKTIEKRSETIKYDVITHRASWAMTETVISARLLLVVLGCPGLCSGENTFFLSGD